MTTKNATPTLLVALAGLLAAAPAAALEPVHKQDPSPEVNPWADKGIPSKRAFGAFYTRRAPERNDEWHLYSRTDEYADIVVRFDDSKEEIFFGRESSYLPVWTGGERPVMFREMVTRHGDGPWPRADRVCRHARARVIESGPDRAVIHWRYLPKITRPLPGMLPDQTQFVDEYFLIRPDRTVIRAVLEGKPTYEAWREAAPGNVMRCKRGERGVEILPARDGDAKLMLELMNLQPLPEAKPAEVRAMPAGLPKPVVKLTFDGARGRTVTDAAGGAKYKVAGHSALWRTGVSGTALELDGYTTEVAGDADLTAKVSDQMTLDFWLAISAYPWDRCTLVEQSERDPANRERVAKGFHIDLTRDGTLFAQVRGSKGHVHLATETKIPRHQWTHVTLVCDAKAGRMALYVNGEDAAEKTGMNEAVVLPKAQPLTIGSGGRYNPGKPKGFSENYRITLDGLVDELRIFDKALTAEQIEKATRAFGAEPGKGIATDVTKHGYPKCFRNAKTFGARYAHLNFHPSWDRMFRMCGQPDIVVTFDKHPVRYILWHGVGYIPMLVNENGFWYSNEFNETWGRGGCYEPMSDKRIVFGRVHILEQSPARVVLKWRYPLSDVHYEIHGERTDWTDNNWGKWATWYMTVYPDGSMVKRMRVYSGRPCRLEWHESMGIMAPNQKPEDILDTRPALTLVTDKAEVRKYDWVDVPPTNVNYDNTVVHVVNMVGDYDPFSIQRINGGNVYKSNNRGTGYSPFPSWNHWPVAQLPSDRFDTHHPHRAAHSSVTHIFWEDSTAFGEKGLYVEKLLMEGMTNQPAERLLPLAQSWLTPAAAKAGPGVGAVYDPAERAYVLTRESGKVRSLAVTLSGSKDTPLVNPVIVVPNWSAEKAGKVSIAGAKASEVRQGVVSRANGVNALVVWMELTAEKPVDVKIELP